MCLGLRIEDVFFVESYLFVKPMRHFVLTYEGIDLAIMGIFSLLQVRGGGNAGNALTCAARLGLTTRLSTKVHLKHYQVTFM